MRWTYRSGVLAVLLAVLMLAVGAPPMSAVGANVHPGHDHGADISVSDVASCNHPAPSLGHACCAANCYGALMSAVPLFVASVCRFVPQPGEASHATSRSPEIAPPPPKPI